jgi:hypothetical protein
MATLISGSSRCLDEPSDKRTDLLQPFYSPERLSLPWLVQSSVQTYCPPERRATAWLRVVCDPRRRLASAFRVTTMTQVPMRVPESGSPGAAGERQSFGRCLRGLLAHPHRRNTGQEGPAEWRRNVGRCPAQIRPWRRVTEVAAARAVAWIAFSPAARVFQRRRRMPGPTLALIGAPESCVHARQSVPPEFRPRPDRVNSIPSKVAPQLTPSDQSSAH